ncbi:hypothetical protein F5146DRAFT_1004039 [Armillaria mellea]|nr:hypothetical protein F5146DRAFT_1004039 [Armillaria mellea]
MIQLGEPTIRTFKHDNRITEIAEEDVIRHLASCGVTQHHMDLCYIYAIHYLDHHDHDRQPTYLQAWFWDMDAEQHHRLSLYGPPVGDPSLLQWWYPSPDNIICICAVQDVEFWGSGPKGCWCYDSDEWHLVGESALFTYLRNCPPAPKLPDTEATQPGPIILNSDDYGKSHSKMEAMLPAQQPENPTITHDNLGASVVSIAKELGDVQGNMVVDKVAPTKTSDLGMTTGSTPIGLVSGQYWQHNSF